MASDVRKTRERLLAASDYLQQMVLNSLDSQHGNLRLPAECEDAVRGVVAALDVADRSFAKLDRQAVGGERTLHEAPAPNDLCAKRAREAFCVHGQAEEEREHIIWMAEHLRQYWDNGSVGAAEMERRLAVLRGRGEG